MINKEQVNQFNEKGYLVLENLLPNETLYELQKTTDDFVEKSKQITESDYIFDLSDTHTSNNPSVRRLKAPHEIHESYSRIIRNQIIIDVVSELIGENIRLEHTKLNFKQAKGGEAIEWHQDWAFYPHTNDDLLEVGIFLDDCDHENGPLMIVPGSHKGPVDDHHHNGNFIGAVDPNKSNYDLSLAEPIIAPAGSISLHHVRSLHGSRKNNSDKSRRVFFIGYCAADAWPLRGILDTGIKPNTSEGDFVNNVFEIFKKRMIKGEPTLIARIESNPVIMPYPPPPSVGSIYENQREVLGRSFGE
jgi:ectoine hydroxylase-related dioxygenase (phytanoyl-CoA dioxygenase family)